MSQGTNTDIAGLILAGGLNSRMGGIDKAFLRIHGIPVVEKIIELFETIFDEVILVTNSPKKYESYQERILIAEDRYRGKGPLGGIHAGLSSTKRKAAFCVACDMPFLSAKLIHYQLKRYSKAPCSLFIPRIGDCIEPLHAIYSYELKELIESIIKSDSGVSIRRLVNSTDVIYMDLERSWFNKKIFTNLNSLHDLNMLRDELQVADPLG